MTRPLFIVGNKRSGTSQLVRVLNLHPEIFVSHESDIVWILHQFHHGQPFRAHAWDSDRGMNAALRIAGHLLRRDATPWQNFVAMQTMLMETGTPWLHAQRKTGLKWIGDKKPKQHTDPGLLKFLLEHFPEARFLHIVRHPFDVVASSDRFNKTRSGDFWLGLSPGEKMERWAFHEKKVLELKAALPGRVHSLRFEDFCQNTETELESVFQFLEVNSDPAALQEARRQTETPARFSPAVAHSAEAAQIAAGYGYNLQGRISALVRTAWRATGKLAG